MTIVKDVHSQRTGCDRRDSRWGPDSMGRDSAEAWQLPPSRVVVTSAVVGPQRLTGRPTAMTVMPRMVVEKAGKVRMRSFERWRAVVVGRPCPEVGFRCPLAKRLVLIGWWQAPTSVAAVGLRAEWRLCTPWSGVEKGHHMDECRGR